MIERLIDLSIRHRAVVWLLAAALLGAGGWAASTMTVDAIPDLSDTQVIVRTDYAGRAPEIVEDQVTFPLATAMLATPGAAAVRAYSMFGTSFVYVIFDDGVDLYWARSRVLEQLSTLRDALPADVSPQLGPDATGVGWVYEYVLTTGDWCPTHPAGLWQDPAADESDEQAWYASRDDAPADVRSRLVLRRVFNEAGSRLPHQEACPLSGEPLRPADVDLAELRSLQDWYLGLELAAVDGVSEIASAGGFVKQYQITLDPERLRAMGVSSGDIRQAAAASNRDVGGGMLELSETEIVLRTRGYLGSADAPKDAAQTGATDVMPRDAMAELNAARLRSQAVVAELEQVIVRPAGRSATGGMQAPVRLADVASVATGPAARRGVVEWNGVGETVGGIVVMRQGGNARATIAAVETKLRELERGLPPGVAVRVAYDRSDLIDRSMNTLSSTLFKELIVVGVVMLLFLVHARSVAVAIVVLPAGVLTSLLVMKLAGVSANIMSLGGIAIAVGVMVDSAIVMVENAHKHLEADGQRVQEGGEPRERVAVIAEAAREVGPSLFFSLLVITLSFLPVFMLADQSGRMFRPLALTKTLAMAAAAGLAVTLIPALMAPLVADRVLPAKWSTWRQVGIAMVASGLAVVATVMALSMSMSFAGAGVGTGVGIWMWAAGAGVVTLVLLCPQPLLRESAHPLSWLLERMYRPLLIAAVKLRWVTLLGAVAIAASTWYPLSQLGGEFMPPLEEGDLLYMPTTDPGLPPTRARELLQQTDALIRQFPEVDSVMGKIGRADTATDPAPMTMFETTITLHRDQEQWRHVPVERLSARWPSWVRSAAGMFGPRTRPITMDELVYGYEAAGVRVPGLDDAVRIPGLFNAWTMPIRTRIDMLATGMRTPVGLKINGPDLETLGELAARAADVLQTNVETSATTASAFSDKTLGGYYLDITPRRDETLAQYGLKVGDVNVAISDALAGSIVTETVEGRERYAVQLRYARELRDDVDAIGDVLVALPGGGDVPMSQVATIELRRGPAVVKSENARLTAWVYVDLKTTDVAGYVAKARRVIDRELTLPAGYTLAWSGQYEEIETARRRLMIATPLTLAAIVVLLYAATRSWSRVLLIFSTLTLSVAGAMWAVWFMDYNLSVAVAVGVIAVLGLDAETSLIILLYLDSAYDRRAKEGAMRSRADLWAAVYEGAARRIRPKTMTVATTIIGLAPLMLAQGAGADTMRRLAAPMIGGLAISFLAELLVYPAAYYAARSRGMCGGEVVGESAAELSGIKPLAGHRAGRA